jgi:hypothetical protein
MTESTVPGTGGEVAGEPPVPVERTVFGAVAGQVVPDSREAATHWDDRLWHRS